MARVSAGDAEWEPRGDQRGRESSGHPQAAPEAPGGTGNAVEAEWEPRHAQSVTVGAEPAPMEPPAIEPAAAGPLSQESRDASTGGAGHAGTAGDANRPVAEERQDSPRHQARFDSFWRFG